MAIKEVQANPPLKTPRAETKADTKPRAMSGITYPYFDLADSVAVAQAIHRRGGGVATADQLAPWLEYKTIHSGTFATRLSSARQFQLLEPNPIEGKLIITERAKTILAPVMPDDKINALADAFLSVALFRQLFERFRGASLPPDVGLKNLLEHTYKILPDRVAQALRVFKNSAEYAGFNKEGADRLVRPTASAVTQPVKVLEGKGDSQPSQPAVEKRGAWGGGDGGGVDTAIIGLLRKLPAQGETWTVAEQKRFLTAFTTTIEFLYPVKGEADDA